MNEDPQRQVPFEVRVFGTSDVKVGGEVVAFAPKKCKWLVILLALASAEGRSLSRRELSLTLWPLADGNVNYVDRHMSRLRHSLGSEAERVTEPAQRILHLDLTGAEFDLTRFRDLLAEAVRIGDPAPIESGVHLRPSRVMMDFPDGELTIEETRVKLRKEFVVALDGIAERAIAIGNFDAAARSLNLSMEDNPRPDEHRAQRLLQIYQRLGKSDCTRAALEAYRRKGGRPSAELANQIVRTGIVTGANEVREDIQEYAVGVADVSRRVRRELEVLVNHENDAEELRKYIRQAPHLLVGSDYVHAGIVMSDVQLGAGLRADFDYIEPQSGRSYIHLFSFTDTTARIFTDDGEFTTQFHRACETLEACAFWVGRNQLLLPSVFGPRYEEISGTPLDPGFFIPKCKLIIGRRTELANMHAKEKLEARRGNETGGLTIRTYDGFLEEAAPTIRLDPLNERAISCRDYDTG
jgi:DNA-binding SARP family transcriptional activator